MLEDRLHVLDVDVSVETRTRIGARLQGGDNQCIAVCYQTGVIAIANGRFVDLYGVCNNSLHPFTFLHQISIRDHVARLHSSDLSNGGDKDLHIATATCVSFPVPGFLLVGVFVEVPESEISGTGGTVDPSRIISLLGFRLYAGSVSQYVEVVDDKSRQAPASVQVYFSFVEPIVGVDVKSIRYLQSFRPDLTPDSGSVAVLFEDSKMFGVFSWKERLSDRQICLAQMKQQTERLVVSECSPDGRYLVIGDGGGWLLLIDFKSFPKDGYNVSSKSEQLGGKRLKLGPCSRSGVITRDNPLEHVRLVHTLAITSMDCAYTSLRWWICGVQDQQKQFVLAGKQDGSLCVFKFIQRSDETRCTVGLKLVQMYPGLASGTHDAVRSIYEPIKFAGPSPADDSWFEFCIISEMRWRIWRLKIAEVGDGLSERYRMIWPSVRDSLDFPAITIGAKAIKGTTILRNSTQFSNHVAKALSNAAPDHSARYPISLCVTDGRLQVIGLLVADSVKAIEASSGPESLESEINESRSDDRSGEDEEAREATNSVTVDTAEAERRSGPTTIQDKYKLPPMQWKTGYSAPGAGNVNEDRLIKEQDQKNIPANTTGMSKLNRANYNERVSSVIQRVETLSSVMKSMRTSFQLLSSDVQQQMNLISEQLEEISRRRLLHQSTVKCDLPSLRYQCDLDGDEGCKAYPQLFPSSALFDNWKPENTAQVPRAIFESICHFNVSDPYEFRLAQMFREMEVPFVAYGVPELSAAAERWTDEYLTEKLNSTVLYNVHVLNDSHYMFYMKTDQLTGEKDTYESRWMTYPQFVEAVNDVKPLEESGKPHDYYYFMLKKNDFSTQAFPTLHYREEPVGAGSLKCTKYVLSGLKFAHAPFIWGRKQIFDI